MLVLHQLGGGLRANSRGVTTLQPSRGCEAEQVHMCSFVPAMQVPFRGFWPKIFVIAFLYFCQAIRAQPAKGSFPSSSCPLPLSPHGAQLTWPDRSQSPSKSTYSPSRLNIPRATF